MQSLVVETEGLNGPVKYIHVCVSEEAPVIVSYGPGKSKGFSDFMKLVAGGESFMTFNARYASEAIRRDLGISVIFSYDVMLEALLLGEKRYGAKHLLNKYLSVSESDFDIGDLCRFLFSLHDIILDGLEAKYESKEDMFRAIEREALVASLIGISNYAGFKIDFSRLSSMKAKYSPLLDLLRESLAKEAKKKGVDNFNPSSSKQVVTLLSAKCGVPVIKKTAKGSPSFTLDVLQALAGMSDKVKPEAIRIIESLIEYRKIHKIISNLNNIEEKQKNGRINPNWQTIGVGETLAITSSDPSLKSFPEDVLSIFTSDKGMQWVGLRLINPELYLVARASIDLGLSGGFCSALKKCSGDFFLEVAKQLIGGFFDESTDGQTVEDIRRAVYSSLFTRGLSLEGILQNNVLIDKDVAEKIVGLFESKYKDFGLTISQLNILAKSSKYAVSIDGYRRSFDKSSSQDFGKFGIVSYLHNSLGIIVKQLFTTVYFKLRKFGIPNMSFYPGTSFLCFQIPDTLVAEDLQSFLPSNVNVEETLDIPIKFSYGKTLADVLQK